ncbi:MAG: hypothetical protein ACR2PU_00470 [Gammaproteobacteria bacterium]
MKFILLILMVVLIPFTALAGDKIKGTSFYSGDTQGWDTGDGTGYWISHNKGVAHSTEGPLGTTPLECHGAGGFDKEGSWSEGICVQGAGDDTAIYSWKTDKGQEVGEWKYLTGAGKYTGIKGEGTYMYKDLPAGRGMSEWEGEVSLAK